MQMQGRYSLACMVACIPWSVGRVLTSSPSLVHPGFAAFHAQGVMVFSPHCPSHRPSFGPVKPGLFGNSACALAVRLLWLSFPQAALFVPAGTFRQPHTADSEITVDSCFRQPFACTFGDTEWLLWNLWKLPATSSLRKRASYTYSAAAVQGSPSVGSCR
jgi:hypothetical protein